MSNSQFISLNISDEILKALDDMGFTKPTPIQEQAIPCVLAGLDVMGQAQTGTGKTCAYGIPAIELCDPAARAAKVLILCPTRELAIQVADEIKDLLKYSHGKRVTAVYGGQHIDEQIKNLKKKPQIIVGTPGRIMDHMRRHIIKLDELDMVVLDEADEMLRMGFREDIDFILDDTPENKQMLLFSATMPAEILMLTSRYQHDPVHIKIEKKEFAADLIDQYYIEVRDGSKVELLCRLIDVNNVALGLVFCNTKRRVDKVTAALQDRGYAADALHGDMKQNERDRVMNKFRHGITRILVATDVAARGIDVSGVEAVFNFDIPEDPEQYVHRIGRTGRAGNKGKSYSFVFGRDVFKINDYKKATKAEIERALPPSADEVMQVRLHAAAEKVRHMALEGQGSRYIPVINEILSASPDGDEISTEDALAALFSLAFGELEQKSYQKVDFDTEVLEYAKLDMVRLFITAGRIDGLTESDVVKAIASRTSLTGRSIGTIELHTHFSFVDVPSDVVDEVLTAMEGYIFNERLISFEQASKKKKRTGSRGAKASSKRKPSIKEMQEAIDQARIEKKASKDDNYSRFDKRSRKSTSKDGSSAARDNKASTKADKSGKKSKSFSKSEKTEKRLGKSFSKPGKSGKSFSKPGKSGKSGKAGIKKGSKKRRG